ncbi:hypothetical protein [Limnohabitans sp.]
MLDHHIIPELRKCYTDGDFDQACKDFAELIGKPDEWRSIQFPAFLSVDSASIHMWAKQLMTTPRVPIEQINEKLRQRAADEFGDAEFATAPWQPVAPPPPAAPQPQAEGTVSAGVGAMLGFKAPAREPTPPPPTAAEQAAAAQARADAAKRDRAAEVVQIKLDAQLLHYKRENGVDFIDVAMRELANADPAMRCIFPQQWMPLAKCTPDVHSPVEHMVGMIKDHLRDCIRENLHNEDDMLFKAATYQRWVRAAAADKGSGEVGQQRIRRSIDKQKCICQILAADKGKLVTVSHTFMHGSETVGNKQSKHVVRGTGGEWPRDRRWS